MEICHIDSIGMDYHRSYIDMALLSGNRGTSLFIIVLKLQDFDGRYICLYHPRHHFIEITQHIPKTDSIHVETMALVAKTFMHVYKKKTLNTINMHSYVKYIIIDSVKKKLPIFSILSVLFQLSLGINRFHQCVSATVLVGCLAYEATYDIYNLFT